MRSAHLIQPSLPLAKLHNRHADRLYRLSCLLDSLPQLPQQVLHDLVPRGVHKDLGRDGLSAEQVLRIFVLYLLLKCTFEQLEFHLADSPTYRAFCRLGLGDPAPKRASLQDNLSRLRPETLQSIHRLVVEQAVLRGVESGTTVRTDTTPVAAPLRAPTDSALLGDAVRVLERLLRRAQPLCPMALPNHGRRVRRRTTALRQPKLDDEEREALYFDLLQDTKLYVEAALFAADYLEGLQTQKAWHLSLLLRTNAESALCICDQTERRVLDKQPVQSTHKRVSLFETHADILTKRNEVTYGHKVCLSFGKTGLVLGAQVLRGNPADATLAVPAIEQVQQNTGHPPHDAAMDGGFASKDNVAALKERGVQRVAFSKSHGIDPQKSCGNRRLCRKLYRFRAGVEGLISWLKRSLAMGQSRWKGEQGFWAYVWGVVVTASLQALARAD